MTYGLIAAVAWGISTIAAAQAARRIGTYAAVLTSQLLGTVALGLVAAVMHPSLAGLRGGTLAWLVAGGLLTLAGWLAYYRALAVGQVGVVSAIAATYGGVAAVLAVLFLGERLAPAGNAGIILAISGVCLAAAQSPGPSPAGMARRSGILLAAASAVTYGVGGFLLGGHSARAGWLAAALVSYGSSVAALVLALPFWLRTRSRPRAVPAPSGVPAAAALGWWPPPVHHDGPGGHRAEREWVPVSQRWRQAPPVGDHCLARDVYGGGERRQPLAGGALGITWASAAGLTEAAALAAFAGGGQAGQVMTTAAVSSLYPVIPLAAGIVLFGERPRWRQVLGIIFISIGLVMITVG